MSYENLLIEENDGIALVKINRPKALNALNSQLLSELDNYFSEASKSKSLRCIILTGNSEKAFVAGADIKEFTDLGAAGAKELAERGQALTRKMEKLSQPIIAAVNGFALGGGLELALSCDFIICSENARFGLPEVSLGIMPGYGGTQRLSQAVGLRFAREMTFTGNHYKADAAKEMGLVNKVVPADQLVDVCMEVAKKICAQSPLGVAASKASIANGYDVGIDEGLSIEANAFAGLFETADAREGITAFVEKRKADFKGE